MLHDACGATVVPVLTGDSRSFNTTLSECRGYCSKQQQGLCLCICCGWVCCCVLPVWCMTHCASAVCRAVRAWSCCMCDRHNIKCERRDVIQL
jgi:hypothetical protein